jgi:hypothetical protein
VSGSNAVGRTSVSVRRQTSVCGVESALTPRSAALPLVIWFWLMGMAFSSPQLSGIEGTWLWSWLADTTVNTGFSGSDVRMAYRPAEVWTAGRTDRYLTV